MLTEPRVAALDGDEAKTSLLLRSTSNGLFEVDLLHKYNTIRAMTLSLTTPLSAEDQVVQSMPDASPVKWHQAHVTWFFETFILAVYEPEYCLFDPEFSYLFNSYYESMGPRRARPARGLVTRPALAEIRAYRRHVDDAMARLLSGPHRGESNLRALVELGLAHEEQHQELILMDVLHLFAQMPGAPAYRPSCGEPAGPAGPMRFIPFEGGLAEIGHDGEGFAFDNEGPRHTELLAPYRLADRLVTNGEWQAFIDDGGYRRADHWLSDGWAWVEREDHRHPVYWRESADGGWSEVTLGGLKSLDPEAPVAHISFYEADAFARWTGKRLPSEAEWEHAASGLSVADGGLDLDRLKPRPAGEGAGLRQMFGDLWQWTRSPYAPYPGYAASRDALGEYNGKFMINQVVLRGGCCATPQGHVRASYRNFFYPHQTWQFSGVRLADDGGRRLQDGAGDAVFLRDVVLGLTASPKTLPCKYFYDDRGSRLFEAICDLPEYYLTRQETALLENCASELAAHIPANAALIEFGSGASVKTRLLLDAAPQIAAYVPIDISGEALERAAADIRVRYPEIEVASVIGDFTSEIPLPAVIDGAPRIGFFPGSTIGNFAPDEVAVFLASARRLLGQGARLIVGFDLVKDEETLLAAYNDHRGVTAQFNLNLLSRIRRELPVDIDPAAFEHRAIWNAAANRIEMHLASLRAQYVEVDGLRIGLGAGETIHTENSHKFTLSGFGDLARRAGWRTAASWTSPAPSFAVVLLDQAV